MVVGTIRRSAVFTAIENFVLRSAFSKRGGMLFFDIFEIGFDEFLLEKLNIGEKEDSEIRLTGIVGDWRNIDLIIIDERIRLSNIFAIDELVVVIGNLRKIFQSLAHTLIWLKMNKAVSTFESMDGWQPMIRICKREEDTILPILNFELEQ